MSSNNDVINVIKTARSHGEKFQNIIRSPSAVSLISPMLLEISISMNIFLKAIDEMFIMKV